jgi:NTE family protein
LWALLRKHLNFDGIPREIYREHLRAIAVCATSYSDAESVAFFHAAANVAPWARAFRRGNRVQLTLDHLMASLAIPFLFRPVSIGGQFYGDGAMRQTAPLSAALHLGAERLLIIGVREPQGSGPTLNNRGVQPSFGQMFGFMLDTLFMDQIIADLERLNSINEAVPGPGGAAFRGPNGIERRNRRIESVMITPSREIGEIARRHRRELPFTLRTLLRTLGVHEGGGHQLVSYLLFERAFTRELIDLGYADANSRAHELRDFLQIEVVRRFRANS